MAIPKSKTRTVCALKKGSGVLTWQPEAGAPSGIRIALEQVSDQYRRLVSQRTIAYTESEARVTSETLLLLRILFWRSVFRCCELLGLDGQTLMVASQQVMGPHQQTLGK